MCETDLYGGPEPSREDLRFWRRIEERTKNADGKRTVLLACGHTAANTVQINDSQRYAPCLVCIRAHFESELARIAEAQRQTLLRACSHQAAKR